MRDAPATRRGTYTSRSLSADNRASLGGAEPLQRLPQSASASDETEPDRAPATIVLGRSRRLRRSGHGRSSGRPRCRTSHGIKSVTPTVGAVRGRSQPGRIATAHCVIRELAARRVVGTAPPLRLAPSTVSSAAPGSPGARLAGRGQARPASESRTYGPAGRRLPLGGRVRHPLGQAPERPRRPPQPRNPRRGGDLARDARDPPRAARGRRQPRRRQAVRRPRARARARRGRAEEPHAGPAGREDRPRGADRADGRRTPRSSPSRSGRRRRSCSPACRARARRPPPAKLALLLQKRRAASRRSSPPTCSGPPRSTSSSSSARRSTCPSTGGARATRSRRRATGSSGATADGCDVVIVDTAGRLQVDEALMDELAAVRREAKPTNVAARPRRDDRPGGRRTSPRRSRSAIDFDGVMLTKLDGDARGGAALSVKAVTGRPIKLASSARSSTRSSGSTPTGWRRASSAWATCSR